MELVREERDEAAVVDLEHLAPTVVGRTVRAQALLATVDGRRLSFEVTVSDGDQTVARGRVDRIMVDRQRFVERAGRAS